MSEVSQKTIPAPGKLPDYKADARRVADVLLAGGAAIVPIGQGYALFASDTTAFDRVFAGSARATNYPLGIVGSCALSAEIHVMPAQHRDMVRVWNEELEMPLGVMAPWRRGHPLLEKVGEDALEGHHGKDWLGMLIGGPSLQREIVRLVLEEGRLVLASTTSLSGSDQRFLLEDVDGDVKRAADIIVDYGLQMSHLYSAGTLNVHFGGGGQPEVLRFGSWYEVFRDYMRRFWDVQLPEGPSVSK